MRSFNKKTITPILAITCSLASIAQAQFVEISLEANTVRTGPAYITVSGTAIFDTSIAPVIDDDGMAHLNAISGSYFYARGFNSPSSSSPTEPFTFVNATIRYSPDGNGGFRIVLIGEGEGANPALTFYVGTDNTAFNSGDGTLPEDPEAYLIDEKSLNVGIEAQFSSNIIRWTPEKFFENGWATYSVRTVENPNQSACSPADFNNDGVLNFFDILEYISIYQEGCP